jgi:hypothetical protein
MYGWEPSFARLDREAIFVVRCGDVRLGGAPAVSQRCRPRARLDPDQVAGAVATARPDVIVHQLTALAGVVDTRHLERDSALTNRLRTEGTDHLVSAGQAVGVRRFVAQGVAAFGAYARTGGPVKSEEDPLDPMPAREMRANLAAIRHLEEAVLGARWTEGIVLRYGAFYGPGTSLAPGEEQFELVRKRKFPLVGDGGGNRARHARCVQRGRRRPGPGRRVAASAGADAGRQEADARAAVHRAAVRRGGRHGDDDRDPRRIERKGEARVGVAPGARELA